MNHTSILFAILTIFLVLSIISPGCLQEKETGRLPTTMSPDELSDISSLNATSTESTITATTTYPAEQSGVRIFKDADSICVGQELNFGLINEGNSTIVFGVGNPYKIQIFENETWEVIFPGGGTQAFWLFEPGNQEEWSINHGQFYEYGTNYQEYFKKRPGLYRIIFLGEDSGEPLANATEFTVKDCERKEPN